MTHPTDTTPAATTVPNWSSRYDINPESGCFIWNRAKQSRGYGMVWFDQKVRLAHRVAWFLAHGRWPADGLVIDHTCNNKACVNPNHLCEVENWQNLRRAFPAKSNPRDEQLRAANRKSQAKSRGTYSPTYCAERGE